MSEDGTRSRRWWPVVAGGLVAWVVLANVVDTGGGSEEAQPSSSATTAATSTISTTTIQVLEGAPLLGVDTGWSLLATTPVDARLIDLDTGEIHAVPWGDDEVVVATSAGAVVQGSHLTWWPVPFDASTSVPLDGSGVPIAPPGDGVVWLEDITHEGVDLRAQLVSLADGHLLGTVTVPSGQWLLGAVGPSLIVRAGGNTYRLAVDGQAVAIADGGAFGMLGDRVVLEACDDTLRCKMRLADTETGEAVEVRFPYGVGSFVRATAVSSAGWVIVEPPQAPAFIVGPARETLDWPAELDVRPTGGTWTPDGRLFLAAGPSDVHVVDLFADGGPVIVTSFSMPVPGWASLTVLAPPTP